MKRHWGTVFFLLLASLALEASSLTGIYFTMGSKAKSRLFTASSAADAAQTYSNNQLGIFVSLFGENFFEITLTLAKDNYFLEETQAFRPRYQVGFELGKLISIPITCRGKRLVSPDFSAGLFYRFHIMGPGGSQKMYGDWGFYGACKVKVNLIRSLMRLNSFDIGYKVMAPVHFSYYKGVQTILTQAHSLFLGISF